MSFPSASEKPDRACLRLGLQTEAGRLAFDSEPTGKNGSVETRQRPTSAALAILVIAASRRRLMRDILAAAEGAA